MNKDTILVCGSDGYIGHPLVMRLLNHGYEVIGVDNLHRRMDVREMESSSAIEIESSLRRQKKLNEQYSNSYRLYCFDIAKEYYNLCDLINEHKPKTIVNLAQQPSAAFSQKSREHTINTSNNNINGTLNCLYAIKEIDPSIHLIQIGSMGEYDQASGIDIEEGVFDFEFNGRVAKNTIFPRRAPSFYHGSKIASTYYIDLAVRSWGLRVTDIMQGVVYGNWTPEIEENGLHTRLDSDEAFGTVLNRFIVQAFIGKPLTVFGNGEHSRSFLALNDSIQCLSIAINNVPKRGEYRTWNQLDDKWKMIDLANKVVEVCKDFDILASISKIPSPRTEVTDDFYFNPKSVKLKELGFVPTSNVAREIAYIIGILKPENVKDLCNVVMPKIRW